MVYFNGRILGSKQKEKKMRITITLEEAGQETLRAEVICKKIPEPREGHMPYFLDYMWDDIRQAFNFTRKIE
jgi:hypothetical protein